MKVGGGRWETNDLEGIFFGAELDGDFGVGNAVRGRDGEGLDGSFGGFDEFCGSGHFKGGRGLWGEFFALFLLSFYLADYHLSIREERRCPDG